MWCGVSSDTIRTSRVRHKTPAVIIAAFWIRLLAASYGLFDLQVEIKHRYFEENFLKHLDLVLQYFEILTLIASTLLKLAFKAAEGATHLEHTWGGDIDRHFGPGNSRHRLPPFIFLPCLLWALLGKGYDFSRSSRLLTLLVGVKERCLDAPLSKTKSCKTIRQTKTQRTNKSASSTTQVWYQCLQRLHWTRKIWQNRRFISMYPALCHIHLSCETGIIGPSTSQRTRQCLLMQCWYVLGKFVKWIEMMSSASKFLPEIFM